MADQDGHRSKMIMQSPRHMTSSTHFADDKENSFRRFSTKALMLFLLFFFPFFGPRVSKTLCSSKPPVVGPALLLLWTHVVSFICRKKDKGYYCPCVEKSSHETALQEQTQRNEAL